MKIPKTNIWRLRRGPEGGAVSDMSSTMRSDAPRPGGRTMTTRGTGRGTGRGLRNLALAAGFLHVLAAAADAARRDSAQRDDSAALAFGDDAPALAPAHLTSLQSLDFDSAPGTTTIGLSASGPLLHHTVYEAGDHLIIEIPGADGTRLEPVADIGTSEVDAVHVESVPNGSGMLSRISVMRAAGTSQQVVVDPANPRRLEIRISGRGGSLPDIAQPAAPPSGRRLAAAESASQQAAAESPVRPAARVEPPASERRARETPQASPTHSEPARAATPALAATPGDLRMAGLASRADAPAASRGPSRLVDARVEQAQDGRTVLRLTATGRLPGQAFLLDAPPPRLVVDLPGTVNEIAQGTLAVRATDVLKIRIAQNQPLPEPVTRVVVELKDNGVPFELIEGPGSLLVVLGRSSMPVTPRMASLDPALLPALIPEPATQATQASAEPDLLSLPAGYDQIGRPAGASGAPPRMRELADSSANAAALLLSGDSTRFDSVQVTDGAPQYQGEPISISMKDAELQEVFRLFREFTGLNIIVDSSVRGKTITLELTDVPWDQALALVLQTNGLGQQLEGNVLRIAPLAKLAAEEQQKKQWEEAQENSGKLESIAIPLSYANSQQAEAIIRKSLSTRGDIQVDRRTNTIIVKDLAGRLEEVRKLVELLDTPTRQVQIEARILETTVDFSKATGVRWGFNYIADRAFGNQTGFSFPRSVETDYAVNLPASSSSSTLGLSFRNILNTFALDLQLQALESRGKARVISRPMVMVQNNQEATISSGFQIPITNTTATETDVTFVPATLSLSVTPQITADGNVIMDIDVHNDTPGFLVGSNPSIATRNATTTVAVPDGGTTVIGGIYQVNEGTSSGRVPFMSRIPLLGWLFRNKSVSRTNDELLIFLTPRIQKTN